MNYELSIGTVISDQDTPTFETVRIKLKAGLDVRPGTLVRIPASRSGESTLLIGRIRNAHENNPNESPQSVNVRDSLGLAPNYPSEAARERLAPEVRDIAFNDGIRQCSSIRYPADGPVIWSREYIVPNHF